MSEIQARDPFDSVTKGCFVILPGEPVEFKKSASKAGMYSHKDDGTYYNPYHREYFGFQRLIDGTESVETLKLRVKEYERTWSEMKNRIDSLLANINKFSIENIVNFVTTAYNDVHDISNFQNLNLPYCELPTALVFAGVNIPDHDVLFKQIACTLQRNGHAVATLRSADCSNLKNTISHMIEQLMNTQKDYEKDDDDDDDEEIDGKIVFFKRAKCGSRLPKYDMQLLAGWYEHICQTTSCNNNGSRLVVIIQDFECFDPKLLEDLVLICSEYRERLPIVFLIGIATIIEILHDTLPKSTLSLLRMEKFSLLQPHQCFNLLVNEVIIEESKGIKLGLAPFKYLTDTYLLLNYSISSYVSKLQYAVMHHYYANPLSFLSNINREEAQARLCLLTDEHLEIIRMQASFRKFVEARLPNYQEVVKLLKDNNYLKSLIPGFIEEMQLYQKKFSIAFNFIYIIQNSLNEPSMRKQKYYLYLMALQETNGLCESDYVKSVVLHLRKLNCTKLREIVIACKEYMSQRIDGIVELMETISLLEGFAKKLGSNDANMSGLECEPLSIGERLVSRSRAKMMRNKANSTNDDTKLSKDVVGFFEGFFRDNLRHYSSIPLHELTYYDAVHLLKKAFNAQPREALQTALGQPSHYIRCDCCLEDQSALDEILPTQNDTCILYKLYLEFGRLINLYDWFVAFKHVLDKAGPIEMNEAQARFIHGIGELQFLGFTRHTNRKVDHVERLTWGMFTSG